MSENAEISGDQDESLETLGLLVQTFELLQAIGVGATVVHLAILALLGIVELLTHVIDLVLGDVDDRLVVEEVVDVLRLSPVHLLLHMALSDHLVILNFIELSTVDPHISVTYPHVLDE